MPNFVSLEEFLPKRLRSKKSKLVSFNPETFRPEHDLKFELSHNLYHHVANPNKNPGKTLGIWNYPQILFRRGIDRICRSISPDKVIGKGPIMSAIITVACNTLVGYKPMQKLYVLRRTFDDAVLPVERGEMISHILDFPTNFGIVGSGTVRLSGPIPIDVHNALEYHAYTLGESLTDTFTWFSAIALLDQPEVPEQIRDVLSDRLEEFGTRLRLKEKSARSVLQNFKEVSS